MTVARGVMLAALAAALIGCAGLDRSPPPPGAAVIPSAVQDGVVVNPGENLAAVAERAGVEPASLAAANGLAPNAQIAAGQTLRLPGFPYHVIQQGETLGGIARGYGVDATQLARANGLQEPYQLSAGQRIRLPIGTPVASVAADGNRLAGGFTASAPGAPLSGAASASPGAVTAEPLGQVGEPIGQPAQGYTPRLPLSDVGEEGQGVATAAVSEPPAAVPDTGFATPQPAPDTTVATSPGAPGRPVNLLPANPGAGPAAPAQAPPTSPLPAPATAPPPASAPSDTAIASPATPAPAAPQPAPSAPSSTGRQPSFAWPLRGTILSTYGPKADGQRNDGINLLADEGTPVAAAAAGDVAYAGNELRGFGNLVLLRHGDGWVTVYAHLSQIDVSPGDQVTAGQTVGRVGQSGSVTQPQLHFEIRRDSEAIDPQGLLPGR